MSKPRKTKYPNLAKVRVEGSNPFARSKNSIALALAQNKARSGEPFLLLIRKKAGRKQNSSRYSLVAHEPSGFISPRLPEPT